MAKKNSLTDPEKDTVANFPEETFLFVGDRDSDGMATILNEVEDLRHIDPKDAENQLVAVYHLFEIRRVEDVRSSTKVA